MISEDKKTEESSIDSLAQALIAIAREIAEKE
jgi:hypothetical protein